MYNMHCGQAVHSGFCEAASIAVKQNSVRRHGSTYCGQVVHYELFQHRQSVILKALQRYVPYTDCAYEYGMAIGE